MGDGVFCGEGSGGGVGGDGGGGGAAGELKLKFPESNFDGGRAGVVTGAGAGAGFARSSELAGRGVPSAFMGERDPERRFLKRRFAPKRPFGTGSAAGGTGETESFLFLSSLPSERFSLIAEGDEVLRLGHDGARRVSIVDSRAL